MYIDVNSRYGHANAYFLQSDFFGNIIMAYDRNLVTGFHRDSLNLNLDLVTRYHGPIQLKVGDVFPLV